MLHFETKQSKVSLRPAVPTDVKTLARLWMTIFPDKFGPILGQKGEAVLGDWFRLSQRHVQTTTMAEVDRLVVGFMMLDTATAPRPDDGRWLWYALQLHNGLMGALRGVLLMWLIDQNYQCNAEEVYIEMLGVVPGWQGQGVACHLIRYAESVAETHQAKKLALSVMIDNTPAIRFYRKMGFYPRAEQRSRLLKWVTGHAGYYEMVKMVEGRQ